jgi:tetratricopeptide (TPR) repeat protein
LPSGVVPLSVWLRRVVLFPGVVLLSGVVFPESATASAGQTPTPSAAESSEAARSALDRGDGRAAETLYRRRLIAAPDDVEALSGWASALALQGRAEEAATGLLRAGERALRRGDPGAAAALLAPAARLAPERAEPWSRYGEALLLEQRHLEAEAALRTAFELDPASPALRLLLAAACWENGRLQEAEDHYRAVVEAASGWPIAWYQLGRFLVWQGRYEAALEPLERAIGLGLDGVDVRLERARSLDGIRAASGGVEVARDAVAAWRSVMQRAPEEAFARYGLAQALRAAGDSDAARRELAVYGELYRRDQERTRRAGLERAHLESARAEISAGRAEPALEQLAGLEETIDVLEARARAELLLGRTERAERLLERALALEPGRIDLRRRLDQLRVDVPPG